MTRGGRVAPRTGTAPLFRPRAQPNPAHGVGLLHWGWGSRSSRLLIHAAGGNAVACMHNRPACCQTVHTVQHHPQLQAQRYFSCLQADLPKLQKKNIKFCTCRTACAMPCNPLAELATLCPTPDSSHSVLSPGALEASRLAQWQQSSALLARQPLHETDAASLQVRRGCQGLPQRNPAKPRSSELRPPMLKLEGAARGCLSGSRSSPAARGCCILPLRLRGGESRETCSTACTAQAVHGVGCAPAVALLS